MTGPVDHRDYVPHPPGDSGRIYCPACQRDARWGVARPDHVPTFWRHWLDPWVPKGERDRCINSRRPVAEALFVDDHDQLVTRATYLLAQGPR